MDEAQFRRLIAKYQSGSCTSEELALLESWYNSRSKDSKTSAEVEGVQLTDYKHLIWKDIRAVNNIALPLQEPRKFQLWSRVAVSVAAAVLIIAGIWLFNVYKSVDPKVKIARQTDIKPGKSTAIMTMANGSKIQLSDSKTGVVIDANKITYNDGTSLVFESNEASANSNPNAVTTISTPRGGTYQVVLTDGTKVFLNADSKLEFPNRFSGGIRRVKLTGEAYFVVVHQSEYPFRVESSGHIVENIGTEFNINAYPDEPNIKTTLVKGSVSVNKVVLVPNQQSTYQNKRIKVEAVDAELATAWKNGQLIFEKEDIRYIMRMISRWYDVVVTYQGEVPSITFSGTISRFSNVSEVLRLLESTGEVKFKIYEKRIVVMN